jgi:hypothetical protein
MKNYLLSEQDLNEIYWCHELLIETIKEKLKQRDIQEEPDSYCNDE